MRSSMRFTTWALWFLQAPAVLVGIATAQSGRCWMEGFVVGEHDYPVISDATEGLIGDAEAPRVASVKLIVRTDRMSKYALKDIPHGDYTLRVSAPGYASYEIPIYMISDTQPQLRVKLRKAKAAAKTKTQGESCGQPYAGVMASPYLVVLFQKLKPPAACNPEHSNVNSRAHTGDVLDRFHCGTCR
jgi:hypothetical protein